MNNLEEKYDIIVVGAGHAGCEAALAAARMGFETICFTVSMDSVALMPCNPKYWRKFQRTSGKKKLMHWAVRWVKILIRLIYSLRC